MLFIQTLLHTNTHGFLVWDHTPLWDDEQAYHVIQYGVGAFSAHVQITKLTYVWIWQIDSHAGFFFYLLFL